MPAHRQLARTSRKSCQFGWPALLLMTFIMQSSPAGTAIMVNCSATAKPIAAAAQCMFVDRSDDVAISPDTMSRSSPVRDKADPRTGKILQEIGKQTIDQPGHFLIGAAPIWASRYLVGVPWYGWVIAPLLAYREWLQWPSNRWWDPPLDWAFLSLGAVVATWRRSKRPSRGELGLLQRPIAR